ncbi:A-kinase anchor protein 13 isoform X2 [Nerophis ophidion]|uniref:A-kinase anchor protein 13 isoform X2 n=1 Tax=Nerophis ophidion TaxID=159077 RepID=UPI002ADF679F|nr:A-kinase anchor protein 13 isoform X2 [Nerophis ophidion]
MKLTPQQAPLYGRCVITVQLADEELAADEEGADYFLLFVGSTQRHLTSTLRSGHDTLQALCPAHDCCEEVSVTLCSLPCGDPEARGDLKTHPAPLAEHRFSFVQDLAFDMAQFLVSTVGRTDGLDAALLLDQSHIPVRECERLDESLALALQHIPLPPGWSLLGNKHTNNTDPVPRETLLHFSARLGLHRVTNFLLRQPGAGEALRLANRQGHTPAAVAAMRGHDALHQLLAQAESDEGPECVQLVPTDARVACHLPRLRTHTLTQSVGPGRHPPTLALSVEQLLHLTCHLHAKRVSVLDLHSDSLHTAAECREDIEPGTSCPHAETAEDSEGSRGYGDEEKDDWSVSVSPREHGPVPLEVWVCLQSGRDYCPSAEGRERPVTARSLSECESAGEGGSPPVGGLPPGGCGEQETEREATEGEEQEEGEEDDETTGGCLVMGQSRSSHGSDAEGDEPHQDGEVLTHGHGLSLDNQETDSAGLAPLSAEEDLPAPSESACDDVSGESDLPPLCEGEPPVDVRSLEENQETAARDYPAEQEQQSTGPTTSMELLVAEAPEDAAATSDFADEAGQDKSEQADLDSGLTPGLSSDDDVSFQSVGSCTTDVFHPTEESVLVEEQKWTNAETPCDSSTFSPPSDAEPPEVAAGDGHLGLGCASEPKEELGSVSEPKEEIGGASEPKEELCSASEPQEEICSASEPQEEICGASEPQEEIGGASDPQEEICGASEPQEEIGGASEPQEEICGASEPQEEIGGASEPQEEICSASEPQEEIGGASEPQEEIGGASEPQEEIGGASEPQEVTGGASEPQGEICSASEPQGEIGGASEPQEEIGGASEPQEEIGGASEPEEALGVQTAEEPERQGAQAEPSEEDPAPLAEDGNGNSAEQNEEEEAIMSEHAGTDEALKGDEPDSSTRYSLCAKGERPVNVVLIKIHRDTEASFHQPLNAQNSGSSQSSTLPALSSRTISSGNSFSSATHRDSGSDAESLLSAEVAYDSVFIKNDEPVTGGDSTSEVSISCSSTDDTASVGPSSSSPDDSQGLGSSWSPEEVVTSRAASVSTDGGGGGGSAGALGREAEEEAKDRVTEVPRRSCLFRNSLRSLSPLRRHSWGPGKNNGGHGAMNQRSYSLEGLSGGQEEVNGLTRRGPRIQEPSRMPRHDVDERGSLVSLTEEQEETGVLGGLEMLKSRRSRPLRNSCPPMTLPLTKSVSMLAISHRDIDVVGRLRRRRRISFSFSLSPILTKSKSLYGDSSTSDDDDNSSSRSFSSTSGSLAYSISEEEPGPLRSDAEGKGATKVSRTFSYLKNKMYKKTREKERDKRDKEKEVKEKDKKAVNGHHFAAVSSGQAPPCSQCSQCNKAFSSKETYQCTYCNACVHKGCREGLPVCAKVKMKLPRQQFTVPDSSSFPGVTMRNKSGGTRERPWSAILSPEDHSSMTLPPSSRRHTGLMPFHANNLSKSLSISNIAGPVFDEMPIKGLRYLSQSTDSLNRTNQVTESMESLTDEGTEMMDGQLMGEFEGEAKELEADSWSLGVDQQYLQQLDRDLVKRQDVIYELMQTEMHHIRTLRIMSEVYSKGLQKEAQLEQQTVERLFPALDELLELHTQHLLRLLERKKESLLEGGRPSERGFLVHRIGDILLSQFSGSNGESMKKIYGRFCSRHNEAVNFYKDLLNKDKRFKACIKKKMSSSIVRRLGIPECILLVTQRITKYPVLIQRILQHTKEGDEDYEDLTEAVRLVKRVIAAVDARVNEHDKRRRLKDFHARTDGKSIMMMKSGQIFAREDLLRRRLIHDGALQLKSCQGRQKDVHALLLSDVVVFLQEKDQKYVFAMLDQRSTVLSLQKLIVREVANEERGLFLITAGIEKPEMMEVLASSKEERNTWMQLIQDAMQSMERDEDEGIPSETEDDRRQLENKKKEMRDLLRQKDAEILGLLEEKARLFRGMCVGSGTSEEPFFRAPGGPEPPRGACIMKDALQEVETLQGLVNGSLGGAMASVQDGGAAGPVCLPRRAETFGGFDSHLMHGGKSADREESEDAARDLRRTESDGVLKKGGNANLLLLLKRNSQQVLHSVSNLHLLLSMLQAVVVQQDSFIEDQRQALSERSSSCSSSSSLSRPSSRPGSLIEQEKQRSLEKQRQELAALHKQQAAHAEERRRREKEWESRERRLGEKETLLGLQEAELSKQQKEVQEERQDVQSRKEDYQRDLERLRDAQRKLDKERELLQRQMDKMEERRRVERTSSTTSEESQLAGSSQPSQCPKSSKGRGGLNPFTSSSTSADRQLTKSLMQLAKRKDKRKKKVKGQVPDPQHVPEPPLDGQIFFC